jgi:ParB family chromosome partitioning protein
MAKKLDFAPGMTSRGVLGNENDAINKAKARNLFPLEYIPRDKIIPNDLNARYPQTDIQPLKENILERGLYHNLAVIKKDDGKYYLISGERRWHAITSMTEQEYQSLFPAGIPCTVRSGTGSEVDEEIDIIFANVQTRNRTSKDVLEDVRRLEELYEIKKAEGEIRSVPKAISQLLDMSTKQVRKYIDISKLIPDLGEAFENGTIGIEDASRYAALGEKEQAELAKALKEHGSITKEDYSRAAAMKQQAEEQFQMTVEELEQAKKDIRAKEEQIQELEEKLRQNETDSKTEKKLQKARAEKAELEDQVGEQKAAESRQHAKAAKAISMIEKNIYDLKKDVEYVRSTPDLAERIGKLQGMLNNLLENQG